MNEIKICCCRICRQSTCSEKDKFELDSVWARLYEFCFGLQVPQYGPQKLCKSCSDKLNDYEQFKQLCLQSEEKWKSLAKSAVCSLDKQIENEENIDNNYDEFNYKQEDDNYVYISDDDIILTYGDKDEKIEECVNNVKDNLGSKCVIKNKKPLDHSGSIPVTHGIKNENINEFVNNLKHKLGDICIDKIKKPLDEERAFPVKQGVKDEKINEFVENLKDKLGEICIKIKKPHDEDIQLSLLDKDEKLDELGKTCIDKIIKTPNKDTQLTSLDNKCQKRKINSSTEPNHSKYTDKKDGFVNNVKGKFGEICIDKLKKVLYKDIQMSSLDNKCRKRKIYSSTGINHSKCSVKKVKLKNTNEKKLPKSSQIAKESLGSNKCDANTKQAPTEFYCGICEYSSTSSSEVDQHFVKHCEDNDLHCKLCSFEGKDAADMVLHRYTHNNQKDQKPNYKCPLCPKKCLKVENLPIHYRTEHLNQKYSDCQFCGKSLHYKHLKVHEQLHVAPKLKCVHCGLGFPSRSGLRNHMYTHKVESPYICEQCGRGFKTVHNLKNHIFYKHTETKPETCAICNRQFKNKISLKLHIKERHSEKKYLCDVCSTGFCTKFTLRHHIFIHHSDDKPFPCDRCDSKYRSLKMLKAHKQSKHSGELPYKCAECGKRFSCRTACKRHQDKCLGVKYLNCCDKTLWA